MVGGFLFGGGSRTCCHVPATGRVRHHARRTDGRCRGRCCVDRSAALAPELAWPATAVIGTLFRGISGRLARKHPPQPRRTAATAGVDDRRVSDVGDQCPAASTQKSVAGIVDDVIGADFVVTGYGFSPSPARSGKPSDTAGSPRWRWSGRPHASAWYGRHAGDRRGSGGHPACALPTVTAGSLDDLADGDTALTRTPRRRSARASARRVQVLSFAGPVDLAVVALYEPAGASPAT